MLGYTVKRMKKEIRHVYGEQGRTRKIFLFLQEVIKEKPLNRKKLMHKAAGLAAAGILFGAFASISFCVFQPWVDEQLNAEEEITIQRTRNLKNIHRKQRQRKKKESRSLPLKILKSWNVRCTRSLRRRTKVLSQ